MKVDNLQVRWVYSQTCVTWKKQEYQTEVVQCIIESPVEGKENEMYMRATGVAVCSLFQMFSKDIGRKTALAKALKNLTPDTANSFGFRKEQKKFRAKFWETYRTMTFKPRWGKK